MTDMFDVAIVGAGPVGLFAALNLVARGHRVVIFDKTASSSNLSRAAVVWNRTIRDLEALGLKVVSVSLQFSLSNLFVCRMKLSPVERHSPEVSCATLAV